MPNTVPVVDHQLINGTDTDLPCPHCPQVWRTFPHAAVPAAYPILPPTDQRPTYVIVGGPVSLFTTLDDGKTLSVTMSWSCTCGALHRYDTPTTDQVECECGRAALLRNKPDDFYVNPRYGQACACCGRSGFHDVPRAHVADWQCRRSW
jgi:hypothetical protein